MGKSAGLTYRTIFLEEHGKLCNEDIQCILDKGICFRETGIMEKPVYSQPLLARGDGTAKP